VTIAVNEPDELTVTICGTVVISVFAQDMFIVSVAVKPVPVIVVAKPVVGESKMLGVTGTDNVTVKLPLAVAICAPLCEAVALML